MLIQNQRTFSWFAKCISIGTACGFLGCFASPPDTTRQLSVPDDEIIAYRLNNEGITYSSGGRFVDAEFKLQKALFIHPDALKVSFNLGIAYFMQGRFDEASKICEQLFTDDTHNLSYRLWFAKTLAEQPDTESTDRATALLKDGIKEAESVLPNPDLVSASVLARSLANLYVTRGEVEESLCFSLQAFEYYHSIDEGLKHVRLLLWYGYARSADYFLVNILPTAGDGSMGFHLRKIETALLLGRLDEAKNHLQSALHLNGIDPVQIFDRKLLTIIVGRQLIARGDEVDLSLLDNDSQVKDIIADERTLLSPVSGLIPKDDD